MPLTTFRVSPGAAAIGKLTQAFDKVRSKQDQQRLLQESDDDLSAAARLADDIAQAATGETGFAGALPSTTTDACSGEAKWADSWPAAPEPIEDGVAMWPSGVPQAVFSSSWPPAAIESSVGEAAVASECPSAVTTEKPDRKALTKEAQSVISKLSGPASMAAAAAIGPKAAMGAALRFGNRMRSAATGSTCASNAEEAQFGHADASVESSRAETQSGDSGTDADVCGIEVGHASAEGQAAALPGLGSEAVEVEKAVALETSACEDGAVPPDADVSEAAGMPAVTGKGSIIKMPVIKIKTGQMPKDLSKVSEFASRATKTASAQAAAMGAVLRKGGQMRSAAASGSTSKFVAEDIIEEDCVIKDIDAESAGHGSEECAPVVSPCSEVGEEAPPVCSVDAHESCAPVEAEAEVVKEAAAASSADEFASGPPAVVHVDVEDGRVDALGGEDVEASGLPQIEADASTASEERTALSPVLETGTDAAPPQPWLLKAQARSGVQALPEGCSKLHESQPMAEDRAAVF